MLFAWAPSASAQIYSWRDAKGTLVISDRPLSSVARTFEVSRARSILTTKPPRFPNVYDDLIEAAASTSGVRADLVRAVIQAESGFNPRARSGKGAMGLMQLMPQTATELGVVDAYNPTENIRGGVAYLRQLLARYEGNEELALAAYNAGPTAVERYGLKVPPFRETRDYVQRVRNATVLTATYVRRVIYKTYEILNGRLVPRYSDVKPRSGQYEIVPLR